MHITKRVDLTVLHLKLHQCNDHFYKFDVRIMVFQKHTSNYVTRWCVDTLPQFTYGGLDESKVMTVCLLSVRCQYTCISEFKMILKT